MDAALAAFGRGDVWYLLDAEEERDFLQREQHSLGVDVYYMNKYFLKKL